jgi:predicted tellurium resistance membrane protein TerC
VTLPPLIGATLNGETLASFAALTFLEVVLGIDNIIFLAIAVARLAPARRPLGRSLGLALAMLLRIAMLAGLVWLASLDARLFQVMGRAITIKDLVLIAGGLFLLAKGTQEVHDALETEADETESGGPDTPPAAVRWSGLATVVVQIGLINIVFSLDSVITAVGMTSNLAIMVAAVIASTLMMLFAAEPVGDFIHRRPTTRMLALAFILLIGMALVADGLGFHIPRTYVYFAIAFSLFVEILNSTARRRRTRRSPGSRAKP